MAEVRSPLAHRAAALATIDAVEVLAPSEDARLTVITCGGTFDPRSRTFSDRLVVIGKLVKGERL